MASNHISHFDPALLGAFFPRSIDWVGMEELFKNSWSARFFSWLRVIPIDRFGKNRTRNHRAFKKIMSRLSEGRVLGLFPEGGIRSGAPSILEGAPMKPGLASWSLLAQAPIIPCVVLGTDRLYSKKTWLQRPNLWIIIGNMITPPVVTTIDQEKKSHLLSFQKQLHAAFPALQQELRERFQLCDDDLPKSATERANEKRNSRLLAKLADASEVQGVSGAQTRSVHEVLEDASTGATLQFAAAVELGKKSTSS